MKKVLLFAAAAFVASTMFTSCKKEYTCECTISYTVNGVTTTSTASATSGKIKKKDAETWCESNAGSAPGYTYKCELK